MTRSTGVTSNPMTGASWSAVDAADDDDAECSFIRCEGGAATWLRWHAAEEAHPACVMHARQALDRYETYVVEVDGPDGERVEPGDADSVRDADADSDADAGAGT